MVNESAAVENVFVFVSDALRWDFLPASVEEQGVSVKTVSASTLSPTSFTSMFTGLLPSNHGVDTFADTIRTDRSIYALDGFDLAVNIDSADRYLNLLYDGTADSTDNLLSTLEPPFIHVERDMSTHAPFRTDPDPATWSAEDALTYLNRESADIDGLRRQYARSAEVAVERFEERLSYLRENDLLESTLVVFTADHGELLGEYCEFSHTYPLVPELVYVPTVLIHPDGLSVDTDLLSHVDLLPTITDVLDEDVGYTMDGQSAYGGQARESAICQVHIPERQTTRGPISTASIEHHLHRPAYRASSVWDESGGWVFNESSLVGRASYLAKALLPSKRKRAAIRQRPGELSKLARAVTGKTLVYGTPGISEADARAELAAALRTESVDSRRSELDEERLSHLESLGYR